MAPYRHRQQRRFHRFRYGVGHWRLHRRDQPHPHRPRPRRRRHPIVAGVALGLVAALAVFAIVVAVLSWQSLERARSSLDDARDRISAIENGRHELLSPAGRAAAGTSLGAAAADLVAAKRDVADSWALAVLGRVPVLHRERDGLVQLVGDVSASVRTGRVLLSRTDTLIAASSGITVNLADLARLRATVVTARSQLQEADRPTTGLWGPVGAARLAYDHLDARLVTDFGRAEQLLGYAEVFLGSRGPRQYLIATENNAEMRDQGTILSLATMTSEAGRLQVGSPSSIYDYPLSSPVDYPVPPGMQAVFGAYQPTLLWQSANATAGFPWSGGDLAAMYRQATGVQVDGVVAIDVVALENLLALTGPVLVPGIAEPVTPENVVTVLLHDLYEGYPPSPSGQAARQDEVALVVRTVLTRMEGMHLDLAALADALSADVAGRHLMVWDAVAANEATLHAFGADGSVDGTDPRHTFTFALENATATKLDYYVTERVAQHIFVTPTGDVAVRTTVTITNTAPAGAPPSFQLGPDGISSFVAGQYVGHVYLWAPLGATLLRGTVIESGLALSQANVSVLPAHRATVIFHTELPHALGPGGLSLRYLPQPRLVPISVTATLDAPGRDVRSPATQTVLLNHSLTLRWAFGGTTS